MYKAIIVLVVIIVTACARSGHENNHNTVSEAFLSHNHEANMESNHQHDNEASQHYQSKEDGDHDHEAISTHKYDVESEDSHDHNQEITISHSHDAKGEDSDGHVHAGDTRAISEEDHDHEPSESNQVNFHAGEIAASNFKTGRITIAPFSSVLHVSGEILAVPGQKRHISSPANGTIRYLDKKLVQGSEVRKGQSLFIITSEFIDENNIEFRYNELENILNKSRNEFLRHKKLFSDGVISEKLMQQTKTVYVNDSLRFYNLADRASASGIRIVSPVSGYIHALNFSEGQYIETGQQILTISSNERLLLRADVPMQFNNQAQDVVTTTFRTAYSNRIYDIQSMEGTLLSIGSTVLENDHFIPIYFEVLNDGSLLEGSYLEFYLKTREKENTLLVPVTSLLEEQESYYVYIRTGNDLYTKRMVITGKTDGQNIEILKGVREGEIIVEKGAMLLKAASVVTSDGGHGHAH